jgi:WD40 repeat protein
LDLVLQHDGEVRKVDWLADDRIVTGSFDGTARIWSATDGAVLKRFEHPDYVEDLAFTSDATRLVTACKDGAVRVWSLETGKPILPPLRHPGSLVAVAVSPGGLIAAGGREHVVRFWNLESGRSSDIVIEHEAEVNDVAFSPDGRWLLTASRDSTVRLWSVATGEQIGPSLVRGAYPFECAFSRDGQRVVVADSPGVRLLDLPSFPAAGLTNARLWIEVITRMRMDEDGIATWLSPDIWRAKSAELETLGGRPVR